ncbi:MAG: NAD(P)H-binding protein [Acidimicrobiales bacterium]|nr:NAD(P)H-binding protein [Acidimicrobiales bacterium]
MTTTKTNDRPVLVLGGTGKTGRRVAERLRHQGIPVRIGSRASAVPFDWNEPTTWPAALSGVRAAYVSYYPDLAVPGAPEAVQALAEAALDHDVRRLVLLSGRGEVEAQRAEQLVLESGADATVVRCAWFMQNFSEAFLRDAVLSGEIALPGGGAREPWVDADDIADVAVAALTEPGHVGEVYELTSPRLYTMEDVAAELGRAMGRPIRYTPVSVDDYAEAAARQGAPDELIGFLTYLFSEVFGRNAHTADGVPRALGRPARDLATFAGDAVAAGVWRTPAPTTV